MHNFDLYTPTKVVFGRGTEARIGKLVKEQACRKVLIHYGSGSVVRSGLLDRVKKSLDEEGIAYVELGGVVPNPRLSKVYEGIELCKKEGVDFWILGGYYENSYVRTANGWKIKTVKLTTVYEEGESYTG